MFYLIFFRKSIFKFGILFQCAFYLYVLSNIVELQKPRLRISTKGTPWVETFDEEADLVE